MLRVYDDEKSERVLEARQNKCTPAPEYDRHLFPTRLCSRASYKRVIEMWEWLGEDFERIVWLQARGLQRAPAESRTDFLRYVLRRASSFLPTKTARMYDCVFVLAAQWRVMCLLQVHIAFPPFYQYLIDRIPYFEAIFPSYARPKTIETWIRLRCAPSPWPSRALPHMIRYVQKTTRVLPLRIESENYETLLSECDSPAIFEHILSKRTLSEIECNTINGNLFKLYGELLRKLKLPDEIILKILYYCELRPYKCTSTHMMKFPGHNFKVLTLCNVLWYHNMDKSKNKIIEWIINSRNYIIPQCNNEPYN